MAQQQSGQNDFDIENYDEGGGGTGSPTGQSQSGSDPDRANQDETSLDDESMQGGQQVPRNESWRPAGEPGGDVPPIGGQGTDATEAGGSPGGTGGYGPAGAGRSEEDEYSSNADGDPDESDEDESEFEGDETEVGAQGNSSSEGGH